VAFATVDDYLAAQPENVRSILEGTLKFPYAKPIPYPLIARVTELLLARRRGDQP
jgi:hypothetical protein